MVRHLELPCDALNFDGTGFYVDGRYNSDDVVVATTQARRDAEASAGYQVAREVGIIDYSVSHGLYNYRVFQYKCILFTMEIAFSSPRVTKKGFSAHGCL